MLISFRFTSAGKRAVHRTATVALTLATLVAPASAAGQASPEV
jgi:hypothetical protein